MTIYSLYIFDRHCDCVYYQSWHRTTPIRPGKDVLPNVAPGTRLPSRADMLEEERQAEMAKNAAAATSSSNAPSSGINEYTGVPRAPGSSVLPSSKPLAPSLTGEEGRGVTNNNSAQPVSTAAAGVQQQQSQRGLPFDEECKLVYGVLFSLRSMMKKLSNKEDEAFISYKTSTYKLHLYETSSGYKFVLFSDQNVESLRFILKQIYQGSFVEFVLRNPMIEDLDSRISGKGIDSLAFRMSVHKFISGLTVFR